MTRLTKNLVYNVVGQGLVLALSLVAVRFIFHRLGDDVFGIILFNTVLTSVLTGTLELGISSTVVREVSGHIETELAYVHRLIGTASFLYWGAGIVLVILIWATAPLLVTHWVNLRTIDANTASTMLRLMSATALVTLPKGLYTSVFRGSQMMQINNAIDVGAAISQQAGILLLLFAGPHVYLVAGWISVNALMSAGVYVLIAARMFGWRPLVPLLSRSVIRRNVGFTGHVMVTSLLFLAHSQAAQLIVSKLVPIAQFGFYGFASSTAYRATFISGAAAQAAYPSLSNLHARGDRFGLLQQYRKLQDLVCYGTLPLFIGICFGELPIFTYVFNGSVAQQLLLPTAFLCLGYWLNGALVIPYMLSIAMGRPQIAARANLYALFVVLPVTAALIVLFGLPGAGFSWVFYHMFTYAYMIPRISRDCLQSPTSAWFGHLVRALGLGALTYGVAWLTVNAFGLFTLPGLVAAYILGSTAFALGAYLMIGSDLRQTLHRLRVSLIPHGADVR